MGVSCSLSVATCLLGNLKVIFFSFSAGRSDVSAPVLLFSNERWIIMSDGRRRRTNVGRTRPDQGGTASCSPQSFIAVNMSSRSSWHHTPAEAASFLHFLFSSIFSSIAHTDTDKSLCIGSVLSLLLPNQGLPVCWCQHAWHRMV